MATNSLPYNLVWNSAVIHMLIHSFARLIAATKKKILQMNERYLPQVSSFLAPCCGDKQLLSRQSPKVGSKETTMHTAERKDNCETPTGLLYSALLDHAFPS